MAGVAGGRAGPHTAAAAGKQDSGTGGAVTPKAGRLRALAPQRHRVWTLLLSPGSLSSLPPHTCQDRAEWAPVSLSLTWSYLWVTCSAQSWKNL